VGLLLQLELVVHGPQDRQVPLRLKTAAENMDNLQAWTCRGC
jgi:hypothetical protein